MLACECWQSSSGIQWECWRHCLQLSSVEAGGSTAFIYANFSIPVVEVNALATFFPWLIPPLHCSSLQDQTCPRFQIKFSAQGRVMKEVLLLPKTILSLLYFAFGGFPCSTWHCRFYVWGRDHVYFQKWVTDEMARNLAWGINPMTPWWPWAKV